VLAEFRGRNDDFSIGNVVVGKEDYFEETFGFSIIVDNCCDLVDQFDNVFGGDISRSCFTCEHYCPWHNFLPFFRCHFFDRKISIDDVKDVHKLSFVLMDTFYLNVEERILVYNYFAIMMHPFGQFTFVVQFNGLPL
jgi:hypothetical protein